MAIVAMIHAVQPCHTDGQAVGQGEGINRRADVRLRVPRLVVMAGQDPAWSHLGPPGSYVEVDARDAVNAIEVHEVEGAGLEDCGRIQDAHPHYHTAQAE